MINFTVFGTDGNGRVFEIGGNATGNNPLDPEVFNEVGAFVFDALTNGKARFGHPGEGGCKGPYMVTSVTITRKGS